MGQILTISIILLVVGAVAVGVVAGVYFLSKRKRVVPKGTTPGRMDAFEEQVDKSFAFVESEIRDSLTPHFDDQPLLMVQVLNWLDRAKQRSDIRMVKHAVEQIEARGQALEAKTAILRKIDEYDDMMRHLKSKEQRVQRKTEIEELTDKKTIAELRKQIAEIEKPPVVEVPEPEPGPPTDEQRAQELREEEARLTHEFKLKLLRDQIVNRYHDERRQSKWLQLDLIDRNYLERKAHIDENTLLDETDKQEQLRILQETYVTQLDEFEKSL